MGRSRILISIFCISSITSGRPPPHHHSAPSDASYTSTAYDRRHTRNKHSKAPKAHDEDVDGNCASLNKGSTHHSASVRRPLHVAPIAMTAAHRQAFDSRCAPSNHCRRRQRGYFLSIAPAVGGLVLPRSAQSACAGAMFPLPSKS